LDIAVTPVLIAGSASGKNKSEWRDGRGISSLRDFS